MGKNKSNKNLPSVRSVPGERSKNVLFKERNRYN